MAESLFSLLQSAAERHPSRIAVDYVGRTITYSELLDRANRVAGFLHEDGVRPGMHVAFCFRKSIDAIVSLFGIIRTGAAYVPLDPAWPAIRLAEVCHDAGIHHWLGTHAPPSTASKFELVLASDSAEGFGAASTSTFMIGEPCRPADDVCSLLYTSGSTGRPKGVRITSRSLLHFSRWAVDTFGITPDDRVANHAGFHFDLSTLDIFGAIRAAATLCPVPDRSRGFPVELAKFIDDQRISVWYSVPSVLSQVTRVWVRTPGGSSLRVVLFAGEVMPKPAIVDLARQIPNARLANLYGPTETNVCTWHPVGPDDLADAGPLPIGQPIDDTRVWIEGVASALRGGRRDIDGAIDRPHDSSAPAEGGRYDADTGELTVAGPTVAAGYHGNASNFDRFVPAPDGRGLAYRTGDRVRRRGDGALMFEGRLDRQLKVRGHRVEPSEIEAVIAAHAAIREVAVVPIADAQFGARLVACLSARGDLQPASDEIAAHCRSRLPVYMTPDCWLFTDALPRTDRGKVDSRALAALAESVLPLLPPPPARP